MSRELGLDSTEVWAQLGYTQDQLASPDTRISVAVTQQLIAWVVAATQLSDYGLRAAEAAEPGMFDLPEYAARCRPTLRGAIERVVSIDALVSDAGDLSFREDEVGGTLALAPRPDVELHPASVEFTLAYLVLAARQMTAHPGLSPLAVRFRHPAPADRTHHDALFGVPVVFDGADNALVLPRDQLELPLRQADSQLAILLDQVVAHLLLKIGAPGTFADEVRVLVTKHLPSDGAPVTAIAEELGFTARTVHRRLAEESVTYRDLADDVRRELAYAHLDRKELAAAEIAYLVGFSSVQAFHRAFKRWAGMTPGEYRKRG